MPADPLLLSAGQWLGAAGGVLALVTVVSFLSRWGIRFRLVGITSFTLLLAFSCVAFAISYTPRVVVPGAAAMAPTVEQVALNLRGNARNTGSGQVRVRLRRIEALEPGLSRPVVLAEATRQLADGTVEVTVTAPGA
jgi:hypothetical protein